MMMLVQNYGASYENCSSNTNICTPESPIITKDTFLSAVKISEWCTTHLILEVDANKENLAKRKIVIFGLRNMLSLMKCFRLQEA